MLATTEEKTTLRVFLAEAEEILSRLTRTLNELENADEKDHHKFIELAFRLIHTIKGSSTYLQGSAVTSVCRGMEDILATVRRGELQADAPVISLLSAGCDHLGHIINNLAIPHTPPSAPKDDDAITAPANPTNQLDPTTSHLLETYNRVLKREAELESRSHPNQLPKEILDLPAPLVCQLEYHGQGLYALKIPSKQPNYHADYADYADHAANPANSANPANPANSAATSLEDQLRHDIETIGALVDRPKPDYIRFRTILDEAMACEALSVPPKDLHLLRKPPQEQNDASDASDASKTQPQPKPQTQTFQSHPSHYHPGPDDEWIHVGSKDLSAAVQLAEDAQALTHHLTDHLAAGKEAAPITWAFLSRLSGVAAKLSQSLDNIWWLPISRAFEGLPAITGKACSELGKEVELFIRDGHVQLALPVIRELRNILVHLIRNALDHGIESPEIRRQRGKQPIGTLTISAMTVGTWVQIRIEDDGAGLNIETLRQQAITTQTLTPHEAKVASKAALLALLFTPGFTTRSQVSETSERGVGLDAVKDMVTALQGRLCLTTEEGRGTTVTVCLPARLPSE